MLSDKILFSVVRVLLVYIYYFFCFFANMFVNKRQNSYIFV